MADAKNPFEPLEQIPEELRRFIEEELGDRAGASHFVQPFTNADLTGAEASIMTITHNLGQQYIVIDVYDDTNQEFIPSNVRVLDENTCEIDINGFQPISGTWHASILGDP